MNKRGNTNLRDQRLRNEANTLADIDLDCPFHFYEESIIKPKLRADEELGTLLQSLEKSKIHLALNHFEGTIHVCFPYYQDRRVMTNKPDAYHQQRDGIY